MVHTLFPDLPCAPRANRPIVVAAGLPDAMVVSDGPEWNNMVVGHVEAQALVQVVKQWGEDLTRENVMKQAASLKNLEIGMLPPGITVNTSANDFAPVKRMRMQRFNGESWELFGPLMTGDIGD
jgi:branched-chain amino acid transport system substrate-binding protein